VNARDALSEARTRLPAPLLGLDAIARRFGTDKASGRHDFARLYERLLWRRRLRPVRVLEIGVYRGASLRMWAAYFPRGEVHGIDIDPTARQYAADRITIHIGDGSSQEVLAPILAQAGGSFDVIVDDGSHRYEHQHPSLLALWPHLAPGGLYAIEDVHTSYRKKYDMGYRHPRSTVELIKTLLDDVHQAEHGRPPVLEGLAAVHLHHQICLLEKAPAARGRKADRLP
jgi:predicted O-methyltransferase YrrM